MGCWQPGAAWHFQTTGSTGRVKLNFLSIDHKIRTLFILCERIVWRYGQSEITLKELMGTEQVDTGVSDQPLSTSRRQRYPEIRTNGSINSFIGNNSVKQGTWNIRTTGCDTKDTRGILMTFLSSECRHTPLMSARSVTALMMAAADYFRPLLLLLSVLMRF